MYIIDINNSLHYVERQPGIRDLRGSYSRYTPGGTGIPDTGQLQCTIPKLDILRGDFGI